MKLWSNAKRPAEEPLQLKRLIDHLTDPATAGGLIRQHRIAVRYSFFSKNLFLRFPVGFKLQQKEQSYLGIIHISFM